MDEGLVYIGKIITIDPIPNADQIVSATVVCGSGGKWRGVVRKDELGLGDLCEVYLPDSLIPQEDVRMKFMKDSGWRVRMRRFRGAASEVVILPYGITLGSKLGVGYDLTNLRKVQKYHKPVPAHLQGLAKGQFPGFIPKTDELNYQRHPELVDQLLGMPYYITEKADGSSTTAFRYKGEFGVCSRNLELEKNFDNGYWKVAEKYKLEEKLPEGISIQWETCGPGIQGNPMGLKEIDGFAFSGYNITEHRYLEMMELWSLIDRVGMPICPVLECGINFSSEGIELLGEGKYKNGKQREGVVVRSQENVIDGKPISFKVINLEYDK